MPKSVFTHHASILAPRNSVWDRLQQAETWENIGPVERVWEPTYDGHGQLTGYRWSTRVGPRRYDGTAVTVATTRPTYMKLELDAREIVGSVATTLDGGDGRHETTITVTLELDARGTMAILFFSLISDVVGRGLPQQVERFAESLRTTAPKRNAE